MLDWTSIDPTGYGRAQSDELTSASDSLEFSASVRLYVTVGLLQGRSQNKWGGGGNGFQGLHFELL